MRVLFFIAAFCCMGMEAGMPPPAYAMADDGKSIILQSTTSTKNSGLYDYLLPMLRAATGITVHVVAVGTGAAINNAMHCDGDLLLTHSRDREEEFVAAGFADARYDLMVNDFVLIGPADDPAGIGTAGIVNADDAFAKIAETQMFFASRGDDSGTHAKESAIWRSAGIDPRRYSGRWYRELGSGMGTTINAAVGMRAYTLADRASWIQFRNKADFAILFEGGAELQNPYGIMAVSPVRCPQVNAAGAQKVLDWLLSDTGQQAIAAFRIEGRQVFFPNARK